jgi:hypothetical protein
MTRSRLYLIGCLLGIAFAVFAASLVNGWGGARTITAVSDLGALAAGGIAVACAGLTARSSRGRQRWAMAPAGSVAPPAMVSATIDEYGS